MANSAHLSNRHSFVTNHNMNEYNLHIAIDFGTDGLGMIHTTNIYIHINNMSCEYMHEYTGIAYAFKQDVYIQNKWNTLTYGLITHKPKCIALFDANQQLNSFGIDAKYEYLNNSVRRATWMLFDQFKWHYMVYDFIYLYSNLSQPKTHGICNTIFVVFTIFVFKHSQQSTK